MNCSSIFCSKLPLGLTLAAATLSFGLAGMPVTGAMAQTGDSGAFYRAELAQPQDASRFVAGGVVWNCAGTTCTAAEGDARPLRMCRELKKKTGTITSFTIAGEALPADQLDRCNG